MGSWEDLDTFLARKHVSLLQTGGGQDELFQHPGSYLLKRQVDRHVSGKGLSRPGPEGSHSVRTPLTLDRSSSLPFNMPPDYSTKSKVPHGSLHTHQL